MQKESKVIPIMSLGSIPKRTEVRVEWSRVLVDYDTYDLIESNLETFVLAGLAAIRETKTEVAIPMEGEPEQELGVMRETDPKERDWR